MIYRSDKKSRKFRDDTSRSSKRRIGNTQKNKYTDRGKNSLDKTQTSNKNIISGSNSSRIKINNYSRNKNFKVDRNLSNSIDNPYESVPRSRRSPNAKSSFRKNGEHLTRNSSNTNGYQINKNNKIVNKQRFDNIKNIEENVYLQQDSEGMLWGRHATQAAFETGRPIHRIWCTSEVRSSSKFFQYLKDAKSSGVLVEEVSWARLAQITKGAVHQGIVLQTASAETLDLKKLINGCSSLNESPLLLALDGITDPHNLGAIIRSAEALGVHGLVLPQRRSAGLTGSVAKVAAGALEHLPVARVINLNRSLVQLKDEGYTVIGLAEEGESTLQEVDLNGPLVVVIGSEDKGISLLTRKNCDQLVRIPLRGITTSLNASIATSVVLYEIAKNSWMKGITGQSPSPKLIRAKFQR